VAGSAMRRGVVRCGLAAVLFGATTPFASRLADDTSAPMLAGLLYLGAALAVAPRLVSLPLPRHGVGRSGRRLAVAVVAGGLLGPLLLAAGLQRTPAATASLLLNVELAATTVIAAVFFREHIGRRLWTGSAIVVLAGVIVGWSDVPELAVGAVLIVAACVCWGLDNCVTAGLDELAPEHVTLAKGLIAGTTNVVIALAIGGALPAVAVVFALAGLGAVGYGVSITLWVTGARDIGAARGQLIFSTAPFVGVIVAWAVLGDGATMQQLIATAVAVFGVALVVGSEHQHTHRHEVIVHAHEHEHDDHHQHQHPDAEDRAGRHTHSHTHVPLVHAHPHVPDLHHRHDHDT
jgi:drug/metabolite transporter (DMT)-like permease